MFRFCLKVFTQTEKHMKPWKEKSHIGDFFFLSLSLFNFFISWRLITSKNMERFTNLHVILAQGPY